MCRSPGVVTGLKCRIRLAEHAAGTGRQGIHRVEAATGTVEKRWGWILKKEVSKNYCM